MLLWNTWASLAVEAESGEPNTPFPAREDGGPEGRRRRVRTRSEEMAALTRGVRAAPLPARGRGRTAVALGDGTRAPSTEAAANTRPSAHRPPHAPSRQEARPRTEIPSRRWVPDTVSTRRCLDAWRVYVPLAAGTRRFTHERYGVGHSREPHVEWPRLKDSQPPVPIYQPDFSLVFECFPLETLCWW